MGQESLERLSIEKYMFQWDKGLREEIDKQYLKDHFMLGEGADQDKVNFYQLYLKTFCSDNCELSNWIWKKINGFLENADIGCIGKNESLKYQPVEKINKVYDNCPVWGKIQW